MWEWIWLSQLKNVKYGNNGFQKRVFCSCFEKQPTCLEATQDQKLWIMIPALYIYCIKVEVLKTLSHFIFSNGSR